MPLHPSVRVCTHVKVTGVPCGSPALRGERFCYFHQRMMRGVATPTNSRLHPVALIENEEAIQVSLMEVINALARNTIDLRRADLMLKALFIAVKNSRRVRFGVDDRNMVREVPDYLAAQAPIQPTASDATALAPTADAEIAATADATQRKPPARAEISAPNSTAKRTKNGRRESTA